MGPEGAKSRTHAYGLLLLVIFVSLIFQLAAPSTGWARAVAIVLQAGTLVLALRVSRTRALLSEQTTLVVIGASILALAVVIFIDQDAGAPAHAIGLAMVAFAVAAIALGVIAEVREQRGVNLRTVFGVLCIYLLLGTLYSTSYALISDLSSSPFFVQVSDPTSNEFLYFSFVTMTTTGYGDLTAATDLGRSVAIAEALNGQIYLVTVVSLMVANLGRAGRPRT
jgi:hypothetical protein